ncbi:hypothetical protein [Halorussus halophilus]|uniref:hypothetical protein n=1 Tax=Halorussus halophilus TaxID=2650975 RepID=UPI001301815E|nr:hypothetical protein [Halorussus halophilus]
MALIELNLEKPALKRVEAVEEKNVEEETVEVEPDVEVEEAETETEETTETESSGPGRARSYLRRMAILAGVVAGTVAARKIRQRRKAGDTEQQDLEEDWQTAE